MICVLILISLVACSPDSDTSDSRIFTIGEGTGVLSVNPFTGEAFGWEVEGTHAAVSYDARQVAYIHKSASGTALAVSDGLSSREIVELPFASDMIRGHVVWSDDDRFIALLVEPTPEPFHEQLVVIEVETGEWEFVTGPVRVFAWRPGGHQIAAFPAGVDSGIGLYLIDPINEVWTRLLRGGQSYTTSITWSPDGRQIALAGADDTHTFTELSILDVDRRVLTTVYSDTVHIIGVDWSPDGRRLALCQANGDIVIINRENGRLSRLTHRSCQTAITWSPDSQRLAYLRREDADIRLVRLDLENGAETVLMSDISPGVDMVAWR